MLKHNTRTAVVCALAVISMAALVACVWLEAGTAVIAALTTAATIFVPAAADSLQVKKRLSDAGMTDIVEGVVSAVREAKKAEKNSVNQSASPSDGD